MSESINCNRSGLSQNPVSFGKDCGKIGLKPAFPTKIKIVFPKTEVLGKPRRTK
jgi:hypothetical protein